MNTSYITFAVALAVASAGAPVMAQHEHGQPHSGAAAAGAGTATTRPVLAVPSAMNAEHAHLHEQLAAVLSSGGKTADAARKVEAVLAKHFVEEEAYALPPLGLLEMLAHGKMPPPDQAGAAIEMAEKLRANYDKMLDEHRQLTRSLADLEKAAEAEDKPRAAEFARALALHAVNEEQILYPAALLVGDYLKLRAAGAGNRPAPAAAPADHGH